MSISGIDFLMHQPRRIRVPHPLALTLSPSPLTPTPPPYLGEYVSRILSVLGVFAEDNDLGFGVEG